MSKCRTYASASVVGVAVGLGALLSVGTQPGKATTEQRLVPHETLAKYGFNTEELKR